MKTKKYKYYPHPKADWITIASIVGSNLVIMLTFFVIAVSLHISSRDDIRAIQKEMQDFHGRLCTIKEKAKK